MMKLLAVLAMFASLGYALLGCSSSAPPPIVSHGTIQVDINESDNIQDPGSATDPFQNGAVVQIVNSAGKVVGSAPINPAGDAGQAVGGEAELNYVFTVSVPSGLATYGVKVPGVSGIAWETPSQMHDPALSVTVGS